MGIFHLTGASVSSETKRKSDYVGFRPYIAIPTPTLLPQKQRDAFLAKMGRTTQPPSPTRGILSTGHRRSILYVGLVVVAVVAIVLEVLWRLQFL